MSQERKIENPSQNSLPAVTRTHRAMSAARTVFLVDDDASVRKALMRLIKSAGYDVQAFASARDFLNTAPEDGQGAACLVLDVRMPGLSGLDLQRELHAANAILPIIFITGHGDIPMSVKAMKEGAVDFLPKPVKDNELLKAIEQALALGIEVAPMIGLQAIGQDTEQEMTGQVQGCRLSPDRMPPAMKRGDVEIAQPRELDVECLAVWRRWTDPNAGHGIYAARPLGCRKVLASAPPAIW